MQLVYGNDGQNYTTIAKSEEITDEQERRLLESYRGYGYVKNRELYSDASKEPCSITYVTTDILGKRDRKILLVRNARMTNYTTPCSYTHMRFFEAEKQSYGTTFLDFLRTGFLADRDLNSCKNQNIDAVEIPQETYVPDAHALSKEELYPLLSALLYAADSYIDQVKVIVDTEGDGYNHRALDVIASVYQYIPYHVRMTAGFSTYTDPVSAIPDRVKFQLYTREAVGRLSGLVLDLSKVKDQELPVYITDEASGFAKVLLDLSDAEREMLFQEFQETFGELRASVRDHIRLYQNRDSWSKTVDPEIWREWITFADEELEHDENSAVFRVFRYRISNRVLDENLQEESYQSYVQEILKRQDSVAFDEEMHAVFRFTEWIYGLDFVVEDFKEWMEKTWIEPSGLAYQEEEERYKYLMNQVWAEWRNSAPETAKFRKVKVAISGLLEQKANAIMKIKNQKFGEDRDRFTRVLKSNEWGLENWDILEKQYHSITYELNQGAFAYELGKALEDSLKKKTAFRSVVEYRDYCAFLGRCRENRYVGNSEYEELKALAEQKGKRIEEAERAEYVTWDSRESVFGTYRNLAQIRIFLPEGAEAVMEVTADGQTFTLEPDEMEELLGYLITPTDKNEQVFISLLKQRAELFYALLKLKVFGTQHFESLFRMADQVNPGLKRAVISYYLRSGVLLSEKTVKQVMSRVPRSISDAFQAEKNDTILSRFWNRDKGMELKQMLVPALALLLGVILGVAGSCLVILR